jgi:tellurite resistance protein TerC
VSFREALGWSIAWFALALLFNLLLWWHLDNTVGREVANVKGLEFLSGYLIEKALSVDNIFVFLMLFSYFAVPAEFQRRVLLYGVIGAIVMRAVMILLGAWLISQFSWILYVFGAFLLFTGVKMLIFANHEPDLETNPLLRWMRGHMRVTNDYHGERFFIMRDGLRYATPLFLVLDRVHRPGIRGRQYSGDLCHYQRSLHCLYLQHVCHHGLARAVFPAGGHG